MRILFTGFDPFGGEKMNPAFEAVKLLPDTIAGAEVIKVEIPTVFNKGPEVMLEAVKKYEPDYVICVGQAGGRQTFTPEFVGINYQDARIKDNSGAQPIDVKIVEDGADAYFTLLPVRSIVQELKSRGIPASISYTAGTFVCNDVMYRLLHYINTTGSKIIGGFIHVPYACEQAVNLPATTPSMSLQMISDGLRIAAEVTINGGREATGSMGETD